MTCNITPEDIRYINCDLESIYNLHTYNDKNTFQNTNYTNKYAFRFKGINKPFHNNRKHFYIILENDFYIVTIYYYNHTIYDTYKYIDKHKNLNKLLNYVSDTENVNKHIIFGIRYVKSIDKYYVCLKKSEDYKTNIINPEDIEKVIIKKKTKPF